MIYCDDVLYRLALENVQPSFQTIPVHSIPIQFNFFILFSFFFSFFPFLSLSLTLLDIGVVAIRFVCGWVNVHRVLPSHNSITCFWIFFPSFVCVWVRCCVGERVNVRFFVLDLEKSSEICIFIFVRFDLIFCERFVVLCRSLSHTYWLLLFRWVTYCEFSLCVSITEKQKNRKTEKQKTFMKILLPCRLPIIA